MEEIRNIPDTITRIDKLRGRRSVYKLKLVESGGRWSYRVLYTIRRSKKGGTIRVFKAGVRDADTYLGFNPA